MQLGMHTLRCTQLLHGRLRLHMHFTEVCSEVCGVVFSCTESVVQ